MPIHFTREGIFADTEEERLTFYDRQHAGDPIIMAHLELYRKELSSLLESAAPTEGGGIIKED